MKVAQKIKFNEMENIVEMLQEIDNVRIQNVLTPNKRKETDKLLKLELDVLFHGFVSCYGFLQPRINQSFSY
jgi:hypothetical protein